MNAGVRLRRELGADAGSARFIITEPPPGYRMAGSDGEEDSWAARFAIELLFRNARLVVVEAPVVAPASVPWPPPSLWLH